MPRIETARSIARWAVLPLASLCLALSAPSRSTATESAATSWTRSPHALVFLRPDAPGPPHEFIHVLEAAGGHVSVLGDRNAAWIYATDEVLGKPEVRRWVRGAHRSQIPESAIERQGTHEKRASRSWNHALEISEAMSVAGPRGIRDEVRTAPPPRDGRTGKSDRAAAPTLEPSDHLPLGAGYYDTSVFMAGTVAVGVWLLEAAGTEFDWTSQEEALSIGGVMAGMDAWVRRGGTGASLSFVFDIHTAVPVSGVPILNPSGSDYVWVGEALAQFGFPAEQGAVEQCFAYNNSIRNQLQTNWAFSIFIADSDARNQGLFAGGGYAWAYLGGPWTFMSRYSSWAFNANAYFGVVPMHETGHIFLATDEYDGHLARSGYLYADDDPSFPACIMNQNDSSRVCQPTRDQLGWRDLDRDGVIEVLDVPPEVMLEPAPFPGEPWVGSAAVVALQSQNPRFPGKAITVARIDHVELRVDAGLWTPATPTDGAWDGYVEAFQWVVPPLCGSSHILQARARTTAGVWSDVTTTGFLTAGSGGDCGPWVEAPDSLTVAEGSLVAFQVTARDPDGDPIEGFDANFSDLPVPNDADFQRLGDGSTGLFRWTTASGDSGAYEVVFTATNSLSGSALTRLRVSNVDRPPTLSVPTSVDGTVGIEIVIDVLAADPDDDPIDLIAISLPTFATFEVLPGTGGRLRWTPVDVQAGTHVVAFEAYNVLRTSATTTIRVVGRAPNPVVTAPDTVHVDAGREVMFTVGALEPNGDLVDLTAVGLPPRATFRDNGDYSGVFRWLPEESDRPGSPYVVRFVATNPYGLEGQASTVLVMNSLVGQPPTIDAPSDVSGAEGDELVLTVTATDPDGDPIGFLNANMDGLPVGHGASFTPFDGNTRGVFSWTPGFDQAGTYVIIFSAGASGSGNDPGGSATSRLHIANVDRPPALVLPNTFTGAEGASLDIPITATDPDGDPIQALSASPLPTGAVFAVEADFSRGALRWSPDFTQAGAYSIQIAARSASRASGVSGSVLESAASLDLTILDVNRTPVADAGGPYHGGVEEGITFDGAGSADPDGDPLLFTWDLGDGSQAAGATVLHSYALGGNYLVVLSASDGTLIGRDSTSADVSGFLEADAFLAGRSRTISLAGGSTACLQLEPVEGSYENAAVDPASLVMHSEGTGTISRITGVVEKSSVLKDRDRDGIDELTVCFHRADLRQLFSLLSGRAERPVTVQGRLVTGTAIRAEASLVIVATGSTINVSPNPVVSRATVTWHATSSGPVRAQLFDVHGRLVRTLLEDASSEAGYRDLEFERVDSKGARLAAGIYFIRLETSVGTRVERVAIMR